MAQTPRCMASFSGSAHAPASSRRGLLAGPAPWVAIVRAVVATTAYYLRQLHGRCGCPNETMTRRVRDPARQSISSHQSTCSYYSLSSYSAHLVSVYAQRLAHMTVRRGVLHPASVARPPGTLYDLAARTQSRRPPLSEAHIKFDLSARPVLHVSGDLLR